MDLREYFAVPDMGRFKMQLAAQRTEHLAFGTRIVEDKSLPDGVIELRSENGQVIRAINVGV